MTHFSDNQADNDRSLEPITSERTKRALEWVLSGDEEAFNRKLRWRIACAPDIFYDEALERTIAHLEEKKRSTN